MDNVRPRPGRAWGMCMASQMAAGPEVGAGWRPIEVASALSDKGLRHVLVVPDAANADLASAGQRCVYYALPELPYVARDPAGNPVFSLTLVLARLPAVHEDNVRHLIRQGVVSFDVSLEVPTAVLGWLANASALAREPGGVAVRPLFVREGRVTLRAGAPGGPSPTTPIAIARSTGGTSVRATLEASLDRDQALALLAALDGGASDLVLTTDLTYRVSATARRRLSGDWQAVYDFIRSHHAPVDPLTRDALRVLFDRMVHGGVLAATVSSTGIAQAGAADSPPTGPGSPPPKRGGSRAWTGRPGTRASVCTVLTGRASAHDDEAGALFNAFVRLTTVILRRLTPDLASHDPQNTYALRARPSVGFSLLHEEECAGDSFETMTMEVSIEAVLDRLLEGRDRDAFIRLVTVAGAPGSDTRAGWMGMPPRPQRFVDRSGPRWPGDPGPVDTGRADRHGGSNRIALAIADGELRSVALALRPESSASIPASGRNAQAMIASGFARPLVHGLAVSVGNKLDWYLSDWRIETQTKERPRHLPVVASATDPIWPDRVSANTFWYAPTFELLTPAPNASPESSPFLFSFRRIGDTPSGPALEGHFRFTLRRGMSEQTRQALAARGNPPASPVTTANLAVSLVLPFVNTDDNALTRHTCPCVISTDGTDVTATVVLATQWVRIAYTLLSNPGAAPEPARISVAYSYEAYSVVRRLDLQLAVGGKQAVIPVVYSAEQRREVEGSIHLDAKSSTLNFHHGALLLKREEPLGTREEIVRAHDPPEGPPRVLAGGPATPSPDRAGLATALHGATALAVRPEVLARPATVESARPGTAALGPLATPALRPGIDLADLVRESTYARRTLVRQEQHDAAFPCETLGVFYRETDDDSDVAVGCRRAMELGEVSYRRYERIPELDSVVGGEPSFHVYRSLQQPGRFLVLPARYVITRHSPGTPDAYKPRLLLYSDEDPTRASRTPIILNADLQPDILPHARRELDLKLASRAQAPVIEYPTAIEASTAFVFHAMDSTPVSAFRTPDSFSISISATAAEWPLLFTRLKTGGVLGQVRFILGEGTELSSNLTVDLRHITGPWAGGAVTVETTAAGVRLTNRIDRPVSVHDLLIVSGGSSRRVPVERTISTGGSESVAVEPLPAGAEVHPAYTTPETAEVIEAVPNAIERIHVNVLLTNQIRFSNHALTAMTVFVRRSGVTTSEQIHVLADTTVAQVDLLLPLTEYVARPLIQLRIVKAFSDGRTEIKEWFDWDLNAMGFVVGLTWPLVQ